MYKLAIVGSRRFNDYSLMKEVLIDQVDNIVLIVSGGAIGADTLAQRFAKDNGIDIHIYYPKYNLYGKKAPLERNERIAQRCEKMIAFAYPDSKGTRHVVSVTKGLGKEVVVIELEEADR